VSERRLRGVIAAFAAIGAALAGYLVFERYTGGVISCTTGGCETVQHSSYSSLAGIPVAVLGLCAYVAIFALSFILTETARAAQLAIAVAGVAFSGYLLWAQAVPIGAFCDWCLASDAIMTVIALLVLLRVRAAQSEGPGYGKAAEKFSVRSDGGTASVAHPGSSPSKGEPA
jgi:uncharacterized membrane protein